MSEADTDRLRSADEMFARALELPKDERADFVAQECGDDRALADHVRSLLSDAEHSASYFGETRDGLLGRVWSRVEDEFDKGSLTDETLGAYRLESRIARGGMGSVYRARRIDGRFESEVAIKVLRRGLDTEEVIRRFEAERRILASLDHPNIARLMDAGESPDGRPYLVMEFVNGKPLIEHCDTNAATIDERLRLFVDVCRAVVYAHTHLIIHRDIKSTNVLVSEVSADRTEGVQVKLLDFGIAKLVDPEADAASSVLTRTGARPLTPLCASPEQVSGAPVTTASDVYQLGLLLFELLAGHSPYADDGGERLRGRRLEEAILTLEASPPSQRVTQQAALDRSTDSVSLARRLKGDLDAIALKAIRKEPELRYGSVAALIADLNAYRDGLPVSATADTRSYRARKFVRRHRAAVAVATLGGLVLSGWAATASWQYGVIAAERDRVREEAARTAAIRDYLVSMFEASDPFQPSTNAGGGMSARELLDAGARRLSSELRDQPRARAELALTIGQTYRSLDLGKPARQLIEEALAFYSEEEGSEGSSTARAAYELALLLRSTARDSAVGLFERALVAAESSLGSDDPLVAEIKTYFADHLWSTSSSDTTRIRQLREGAVAALRSNSAAPRTQLADALTMSSYGAPPDVAVPAITEALEIRREVYGDEHPVVAGSLNDLSLAVEQIDRDRADSLMAAAAEIFATTLGTSHRTTLTVMSNLAASYRDNRGDYQAAEALYRQVIDQRERSRPVDRVGLAYPLYGLGSTLMAAARYGEAEAPLRRSHELLAAEVGWAHELAFTARVRIGECLGHLNRLDEAAALLESSREGFAEAAGLSLSTRLATLRALNRIYLDQGRQDAAARIAGEISTLESAP